MIKVVSKVAKHLSNIPGWSSRDRLVVFLVDDWGTIRIPGREARAYLNSKGIDTNTNPFDRYDTVASGKDMSSLFDVLSSHKDASGVGPSFTALCVTANPDFEKIRASEYEAYHYEPIKETIDRYYGGARVFETWRQGIEAGLFLPQFHGREHLNVGRWLAGLRSGDQHLRAAFDVQAIGPTPLNRSGAGEGYLAAFDVGDAEQIGELAGICQDGLTLFERLFGYQAALFTSSALLHPGPLEKHLSKQGIRYVDRAKCTLEPVQGGRHRRRYFRMGQRNSYGQRYITRNCMFEPCAKPEADVVDATLRDIEIAFRWGKPAIISSHRVNYVGAVEEDNRARGLKALDRLLTEVRKHWPDVHFLSFRDFSRMLSRA
jgi:hypothetical protein